MHRKILYLHDESIFSNKANIIQIIYMCSSFSDLGYQVSLAVPDSQQSEPAIHNKIYEIIPHKTNIKIITYSKLRWGNKLNMLGGYFGIKNILKKTDADLCLMRNPLYLKAAINKKCSIIFESHSATIHNRNMILDQFWRYRLINATKSPHLKKFVCISNALAQVWKNYGVSEKKSLVLHDAVDALSFPVDQPMEQLRDKLDLPKKEKIVLYAGSLYENRGIEIILKLAESFPNALFVVLGGPEDRKMYYEQQALASKIRNIRFLGFIPHYLIKNYLVAADILLMIWTKEVKTINYCSPLKMFEYMAAGRIIVGHAFPTITEVLKDGESALLAEPSSYSELESKMLIALKCTYPNAMATKSRDLAVNLYSWKARAQAMLESISY